VKTSQSDLTRQLLEGIRRDAGSKPIRLMEFCGGHTVAILKNGLRQLLPPNVRMSSGPGCPVCVTASADIDRIIALSTHPRVITATFGDLMRVPGSQSTLQQSRAEGHDVRVVYSALEALDLARSNPGQQVVMVGIGFETTAPTIAASLVQARQQGLNNYLVLSLHKLTPPATRAILDAGEVRLDGIICPGHVSAIIGSRPYEPVVQRYGVACVVTGFEPLDILQGVAYLTRQISEAQPRVEIAYRRAVRPEGNLTALALMDQVFEVAPAIWRGFGEIPASGLKLKPLFGEWDAERQFSLPQADSTEPAGCLCGAVLRGVALPAECGFFGHACSPEHPVGPCMVSSEGACSAYYLYGGQDG
jgi:hydrogenase expression/formation protein HypD